jgi:hypothetical protein
MMRRRRHLVGAALAAILLVFGIGTPAQATPKGLYDCQSVSYIPILANKPVNGSGCVGPVGTAPAGSVYEIPTGKRYSCQLLKGTLLPNGSLWVHGDACNPF